MRVRRALTAICITVVAAGAQGQGQGQDKPRVHIIGTGGTISNLGGDARRTIEELVTAIPGLANAAQVTFEQFSNIASGAITHEHWRNLATRIAAIAKGADAPAGIVVTHGTDTMEETAFFLELTVPTCAPIVLTGAMRQANAVGADGPANLLNAVRVAAAPHARGHGVLILMNDEIFRARDATKTDASRMDAFTAPNVGPIGITDPDSVVMLRPPSGKACTPLFDLAAMSELPRVDVLYAYVAADSVLVDAAVAAGARGLVIAGVGRGGIPPSQQRAVRRAVQRGVYVAVSTRTGAGRVGQAFNPDSMSTGALIPAQELNPQKARILLLLGLGAKYDAARIAALFRTP